MSTQLVPARSQDRPPAGSPVRERVGRLLLSPAVLALLGILASYLITARTLAGDRRPALLLLGAVSAATVILLPRGAMLLLLLLTSTFFLVPIGAVSAGGIRSDVAELLAALLILVFGLARSPRRRRVPVPVLGLLLLMVSVVIGATWSLVNGGMRDAVIGDAKSYGFYLVLLPMAALFADESGKQRLERWVLVICTVAGLLTLLAVATQYPLEGRPGVVLDMSDASQVSRVRPALLPLLFLATLLLASRITRTGWTARRVGVLGVFLAVWAVSFNRSSWVSLAAACALFAAFRPGPRRPRRSLVAVLVGVLAAPALFLTAANGTLGATAAAVGERITTIGRPQTFTRADSSFEDRQKEYDEARAALRASPLLGVGVGNAYGARLEEYSPQLQAVVYRDRLFSHNSLLYLYLQTGVLGVIAMLTLGVQLARRCWRTVLTQPGAPAARASAAGFAMIGALLESLANPNLLARSSIMALAVAATLMLPPSRERVEQ